MSLYQKNREKGKKKACERGRWRLRWTGGVHGEGSQTIWNTRRRIESGDKEMTIRRIRSIPLFWEIFEGLARLRAFVSRLNVIVLCDNFWLCARFSSCARSSSRPVADGAP